MKKVKQFTLRKTNNCAGFLFDSTGTKCCVTGAFFRACGASVANMQSMTRDNVLEKQVGKLYSKELSKHDEYTMENLVDEAVSINDNKKTNWTRRLKKLREVFSKIGVKINFYA